MATNPGRPSVAYPGFGLGGGSCADRSVLAPIASAANLRTVPGIIAHPLCGIASRLLPGLITILKVIRPDGFPGAKDEECIGRRGGAAATATDAGGTEEVVAGRVGANHFSDARQTFAVSQLTFQQHGLLEARVRLPVSSPRRAGPDRATAARTHVDPGHLAGDLVLAQ